MGSWKRKKLSEFFQDVPGAEELSAILDEYLQKHRADPSLLHKIVQILGNENLADYEQDRLLKELTEPQYGEHLTEETLEDLINSYKENKDTEF